MPTDKIPMGIPTDMSKERLFAVLEEDHCYLPDSGEYEDPNPDYCTNLKGCGVCIFWDDNRIHRRHMLIQYGLDQGWLTKAEALKHTLDKVD